MFIAFNFLHIVFCLFLLCSLRNMTKLFLLLFFYFFYILPIYSQFCSSDDFIVRKRGIDYLRIHGPTEVITCNSQNICLFDQDSTNEIQTLSLDGELLTLTFLSYRRFCYSSIARISSEFRRQWI